MATLFPYSTLKGLLPGIDPRQAQQPFCVSGNNFMLDISSVYTSFGSGIVNPEAVDYPKGCAAFKMHRTSDVAVCTDSGIYKAIKADVQLEPLWLALTPTSNNWPWTYAFVGGLHYFCRRGYPLVCFSVTSNAVVEVPTTYLPANPSFIAAVSGRLVVLGDEFYAWSAFDDGTDFATSTVTKAGAQFTALVGGGEPRALFAVTNGFYVATTEGVIKATYTDTVTLFEHDEVDEESLVPVDPNAWVAVDNKFAILITSTGVYRVDSKQVGMWQPVISEFVQRKLTPTYKSASIGTMKLHYLADLKYLFLSTSLASSPGTYTKAYVYDFNRDEWGSFDQLHCAIGVVPVLDPTDYQWEYGFVTETGLLRKFTELPQIEELPTVGDFYRPLTQIAPLSVDGVMEPASRMLLTGYDPLELPEYSGFYSTSQVMLVEELSDIPAAIEPVGATVGEDWNLGGVDADYNVDTGNEDWNTALGIADAGSIAAMTTAVFGIQATKTTTQFGNLVSDVMIGAYRLTDERYPDTLSYVTDVMISMDDPIGVYEYEDWNEDGVAEDWNTATGSEDWGVIGIAAYSYRPFAYPTIDGSTVYDQEWPLLEVSTHGETKQYAVTSTGLFHFIKLLANEPNEAFRLKHLELNGNLGGKL